MKTRKNDLSITILMLLVSLSGCLEKRSEGIKEHTIQTESLWVYVGTDEQERLDMVIINDTSGRTITVIFSDSGISYYEITDGLTHSVSTSFSPLGFLNGQPVMPSSDAFPPLHNPDIKIAENSFFRFERFRQAEFRYVIDFSQEPFFFVIE